MKTETNLNDLENSIDQTLKVYANMPLSEDSSKLQAIQVLSKEISLVTNEKKRVFDQEMQKERYELEKDDKYWREKFEEKKLNEEQSLAKERLALDKDKQNAMLKIESEKLEIEKNRLESDKSRLELEKDNKNWSQGFEEQKFKEEQSLAKEHLSLDKDKQEAMLKIETTKLEIERSRLEIEKTRLEQELQDKKEDRKQRWVSLGTSVLSIIVPTTMSLIALIVYNRMAKAELYLIYKDEGRSISQYKDALKNIKNLTK